MRRALTLGLMLLATAASSADLALATRHTELRELEVLPSRASPSRKVQWAPSGNFSALHARAVFGRETETASRPYAGEEGKTAAGAGIFLSRDSYEGQLNSAPSLHRFAYTQANPLRYTDPTGHCGPPCLLAIALGISVVTMGDDEVHGSLAPLAVVGAVAAPEMAVAGGLTMMGVDSAIQGARQLDGTQQGYDFAQNLEAGMAGGVGGTVFGAMSKAPAVVQALAIGVAGGVGIADARSDWESGNRATSVVKTGAALLPVAMIGGPNIRLPKGPTFRLPNEPLLETAPIPVSNSSGPRVASEGRTSPSPVLMRVPEGSSAGEVDWDPGDPRLGLKARLKNWKMEAPLATDLPRTQAGVLAQVADAINLEAKIRTFGIELADGSVSRVVDLVISASGLHLVMSLGAVSPHLFVFVVDGGVDRVAGVLADLEEYEATRQSLGAGSFVGLEDEWVRGMGFVGVVLLPIAVSNALTGFPDVIAAGEARFHALLAVFVTHRENEVRRHGGFEALLDLFERESRPVAHVGMSRG